MRAIVLVATTALAAATAQAQYFVPDPSPALGRSTERRRWVAPERLFALDLPDGWNVAVSAGDPSTVELRPADPSADATLFVRRLRVAPGVHPRQLLLNALEQRLRALPSFREGPRRDVRLAGSPAAVVSATYYHQGNAQYPRALEELFVVRGEEAYAFHFDCFEPAAATFAPALELVYRSFVIRPPGRGGEGVPPAPAAAGGVLDTDRIPF